ncbi:MAG: response regulator [Desulfuromonadales bacterium]|nr:response regulator [Desulfuromonadales bacterium]
MGSPGAQSTAHILLVDDDREIRDLLGRFLTKHGYRVTPAQDGNEMRRALADWRINLVVLDLMLPGEDGLCLCRDLRAKSQIPVIMLTTMGEETDRITPAARGHSRRLRVPSCRPATSAPEDGRLGLCPSVGAVLSHPGMPSSNGALSTAWCGRACHRGALGSLYLPYFGSPIGAPSGMSSPSLSGRSCGGSTACPPHLGRRPRPGATCKDACRLLPWVPLSCRLVRCFSRLSF